MEKMLDEQMVSEVLVETQVEAEALLKDEDKMERFFQRLEKKLKIIPCLGDMLAYIPVLVSLIRNYVKKAYHDVPIGCVLAILGALLYLVSGLDFVPDGIPVVGYFDDLAVLTSCMKLVDSDVTEYVKWRDAMGYKLDV